MNHMLRKALGITRQNLALESEEDSQAAMTSDPTDTVVLRGPLADNYADALNAVYAKDAATDPSAQPEPGAETGINIPPEAVAPEPGAVIEPEEATKDPSVVTNVVLESQAQDAAIVQTLHSALTPEDPPTEEYMTLYAVAQNEIEPEDVTNVTELLQEADEPENVAVLIDDAIPADPNATEEDKEKAGQMAAALESLVVAMGGKVVHNFKGYVDHYKARRTKK